MTAGEGEVGDKGVENLYLIDTASPNRPPLAVAEGFGAAYVYVGADAGKLYFLTSLELPTAGSSRSIRRAVSMRGRNGHCRGPGGH